MVVLTVILLHPVTGLFKMWATRKLNTSDAGPITTAVAGATNIVT